jgi:hypothetical protein
MNPPKYLCKDSILIMAPFLYRKEDAEFQSHPKQKAIVNTAERAGCCVRIDTLVTCDLEMVMKTLSSDIPLLRDRRKRLDVSFMSPHFTPWDDLYELDGEDWKLRWKWKISDIDSVQGQNLSIEV